MARQEFQIKTSVDVARFAAWLVLEKRIDFNPDDLLSEVVSFKDGSAMFSVDDGEYYDRLREECFEVCEREQTDIYQICMRVMALFHYCDKNETMQQFYDNNIINNLIK